MPKIHLASAENLSVQGRAISRSVVVPLLLALCLLTLSAWAQSPAAPARGVAQVLVEVNLTDNTPLDHILVNIIGNESKDLLLSLSATLGEKLNMAPQFQSFERSDDPALSNGQLGLSFYLPVVTDGKTLPISSFLEAFAPYAEKLRMIFLVKGQFAYQGYAKFENADVRFTVEQKSFQFDVNSPASKPVIPFAFFDVDAIIKNPSLSSAAYADVQSGGQGKKPRRNLTLFILFGLAIVIGVSGGLLIIMLVKHWKKEGAASAGRTSNGGQREREHKDA